MGEVTDRPQLEQGIKPLCNRSSHVIVLWLIALGCFFGEGIYLGVIDRDFENFEHEFPIWTAILFFVSIWSVLDIRHAEREYVDDFEHDMKRYLVRHGKEHELENELSKIKYFRKTATKQPEEEIVGEEKV